jgi:uncharacterized protein (TIGR02270 family)
VTRESPVQRTGPAAASTPTAKSRAVSAIGFKRAFAVAEEAAFLWVCRGAVSRSSAVTFDVLARVDERLSQLVYKLSERPFLAEPFLRHDSAAYKSGLMFVTAFVALRAGVPDVFDQVLTQLDSESELIAPLASALTWLEYSEVRRHIERLLAASDPALLRLGLVAAVAHRVDPGKALDRALEADDVALRATALEAVGRLAIKNLRPRLHAALGDEDAICRFRAAWSGVRLGDRGGIPVLGRFAADNGAFATPACDMALRALDTDQAIHAQHRLLSITGNKRLAIRAAGIIGDPALANLLLETMESPTLARCAGAAFCLMAGCDLRRDDLDTERPPGVAAPDAVPESVSDTNAAEDEPDDDLAWPDLAAVRKWWDGHGPAFTPGIRYVAGLPIRPSEMSQVLLTGNQQQRAAAALELALLHPDAPLLDVTAPAHRQIGRSARPSRVAGT